MQAVQVEEFGGPDVLGIYELPAPEPADGQVLIGVEAADVMFLDTRLRSGWGIGFFPVQPPYVPGGAVGGREDVMRHLAFGDADWNRRQKIRHNGTFNANPLSAAAGVATLERVATGEPGARAAELCQTLIAGLNQELCARELAGWAAYGDASIFHLLIGSSVEFAPGELPGDVPAAELKRGGDPRLIKALRLGLNNHGVDLMRGRSGFLSAAHTEADVAETVAAFAATLDEIAEEIRD